MKTSQLTLRRCCFVLTVTRRSEEWKIFSLSFNENVNEGIASDLTLFKFIRHKRSF